MAFQESPVIGIGPDVYRKTCSALTEGLKNIDRHTHPHNFYIQLVGETGLIGLFAGCLMTSIIITCFSYRCANKENLFYRYCVRYSSSILFPAAVNSRFLWAMEQFVYVVGCCVCTCIWKSFREKRETKPEKSGAASVIEHATSPLPRVRSTAGAIAAHCYCYIFSSALQLFFWFVN